MAKFWLEDDTITTTDKILDEYHKSKSHLYTRGVDDMYIKNNCDKYIISVSEYDLFTRIQRAINNGCTCVLDAITGKQNDCPKKNSVDNGEQQNYDCDKCILEWMTKSVK